MPDVADFIPSEKKNEDKNEDKSENNKSKSSWKDSLEDNLKNASELENIADISSLAKSYVSLSKLTSQKHEGISKEDTWENFQIKARNFFKISESESEYDFDSESDKNTKDFYRKLGFELNLHPMQTKALLEKISANSKTKSEENLKNLENKWKNETKESIFKNISNKDEILGKALKKLEITSEELTEKLGVAKNHPIINKMLFLLGTEESKEDDPITTEN